MPPGTRNALVPPSPNAFTYGMPSIPYNKPTELPVGRGMVRTGLGLYDLFSDRKTMPANRRIFLESVLDEKKDPITERDFSPKELSAVKQALWNQFRPMHNFFSEEEQRLGKVLASKKVVDSVKVTPEIKKMQDNLAAIQAYKRGEVTPGFLNMIGEMNYSPAVYDYRVYKNNLASDSLEQARKVTGNVTPLDSIHTTLGRFTYGVDPKTNEIIITDTYDFNSADKNVTSAENVGLSPTRGSSAMYDVLRSYAGQVLPEGKGRDVRIRLNSLAPPNANYNRRK